MFKGNLPGPVHRDETGSSDAFLSCFVIFCIKSLVATLGVPVMNPYLLVPVLAWLSANVPFPAEGDALDVVASQHLTVSTANKTCGLLPFYCCLQDLTFPMPSVSGGTLRWRGAAFPCPP